jgi:hypothetical protein
MNSSQAGPGSRRVARRILILVSLVMIVVVAVLYSLGRSRVEEAPPPVPIRSSPEEARLQCARLYFGDPGGPGLRPEDRILVAGPRLDDRLRACVRELAAGSLTGSIPVLPAGTRLKGVFLDPWGLAYLDFDRAILGGRVASDEEEWLAVASLVRTICDNFPEVREVRFMIDGLVVTSLSGYIDLEQPLRPEDFPLAD